MLVRPGNPDFLDLPWRAAAGRLGERSPRRGDARHPPPRRALRQLRRARCMRSRRCRRGSRGSSTACCARWTTRSCRWSMPSASSPRTLERRRARARGGADHAASRLLAAVPQPVQRARRAGSAQQPARRARRVARAGSTSRASSGATARSRTRSSGATPARSRPISSMPRRASCTRSSARASARTTCRSPRRTWPASCSTSRRREVGLPSGLDPIETAAEVPRRYEALWSELTREDVFGPGRDLPHRRAPAPPQRARLRRRGGQARR